MNAPVDAVGGIEADPKISDFLSLDRIVLDLDTSSRKRLFEQIAEISSAGLGEISEECVLKTITERERIGSTGLGRGIAVPHGRIENLDQPVVSVIRLKHPIKYDTPDDLPVWLAVGLLVPAEANEAHLKLLAVLAGCFQNNEFVDALRASQTALQVSQLFDCTISS